MKVGHQAVERRVVEVELEPAVRRGGEPDVEVSCGVLVLRRQAGQEVVVLHARLDGGGAAAEARVFLDGANVHVACLEVHDEMRLQDVVGRIQRPGDVLERDVDRCAGLLRRGRNAVRRVAGITGALFRIAGELLVAREQVDPGDVDEAEDAAGIEDLARVDAADLEPARVGVQLRDHVVQVIGIEERQAALRDPHLRDVGQLGPRVHDRLALVVLRLEGAAAGASAAAAGAARATHGDQRRGKGESGPLGTRAGQFGGHAGQPPAILGRGCERTSYKRQAAGRKPVR